jgi:hypothetical protein
MTTTVVKAIMPAGGGDYTSLNAWDAARRADIVAGDRIEIAEVYSGGNAVTGYVDINGFFGWNCDSTHYIEIRAATGHEHTGVWSTSKAYMQVAGYTVIHFGRSIYSYLKKMQVRSTDTPGVPVIAFGDNYFPVNTYIVDRCLVVRTNNAGSAGTGVINVSSGYNVYPNDCRVYNSIIIDNGTIDYHFGFSLSGGPVNTNLTVYNCTIFLVPGAGWNQGFYASGGTITTQNCYIGGNGAYYNDGGANVVYNKGANDATKSTDAVTPALRSIPSTTATFLNVSVGSENLRPVVSQANKLLDNGANLTGQGITYDIIGTARPQFSAFDIGAFENDIPICWNYTARYKNSNKIFKASGCGNYPKSLRVPSNIDKSTGRMIDDGIEIDSKEYEIE